MCRDDGEKMAVIMFMGDKCSERSSRESAPVSATPPDFLHYLTSYFLLPICILQYPKLPFAYCSGYASPHSSPCTAKHAHSCDSLPGLHYELLHSANIQMTVLGDVSQPTMRYLLDRLLLWHMARYRQVLLEFRRQ